MCISPWADSGASQEKAFVDALRSLAVGLEQQVLGPARIAQMRPASAVSAQAPPCGRGCPATGRG